MKIPDELSSAQGCGGQGSTAGGSCGAAESRLESSCFPSSLASLRFEILVQ